MMTVELLSVLFSCDINVLLHVIPELTNTVFFGSFINNVFVSVWETCIKQ